MLKPLPPAPERVLREQQISETAPGSILRDFATFLDCLASQPVATTSKHHLLPMNALAWLNTRMTQPLEIRLKRPAQKSYQNLRGLHLPAHATGLMRVQKVKSGALLALDGPAISSWGGLNPTERYFALLEAWWLRAALEMLGERGHGWMRGLFDFGDNWQFDVLLEAVDPPKPKAEAPRHHRFPRQGAAAAPRLG